MAIEPKLNPFPDSPVKMGYSFFKSIRDRIETIAPIPTAGPGAIAKGPNSTEELIKVEYISDKGCKISFNANAITLTVCSNGVPTELVVFGK